MRDTLLVVCTKYMHKAWADNKSPKAVSASTILATRNFVLLPFRACIKKNFKEGAARNFQQEGLWLYSTKKGMMQAAVAEGCAFFPVFLSRFFLIFFPGKHRD